MRKTLAGLGCFLLVAFVLAHAEKTPNLSR